jgi:hypothetical protein
MNSHFEVPSGGNSKDGSGFSSMDGRGLSGAISTDGKSSRLSQISWALQLFQ